MGILRSSSVWSESLWMDPCTLVVMVMRELMLQSIFSSVHMRGLYLLDFSLMAVIGESIMLVGKVYGFYVVCWDWGDGSVAIYGKPIMQKISCHVVAVPWTSRLAPRGFLQLDFS